MRQHLRTIHHKITSKSPRAIAIRIGLYFAVAFIIALGILRSAENAQSQILAQVPTPSPIKSQTEPTLSSNTILIRLKKNAKTKINKKNVIESNITGFKELRKKYKIKKIEQLAIPSDDSNQNANIFSWYRITLDEKSERIVGRYDAKNKKITSNNAKAKQLQDVIDTAKSDSDIELIAPDFIATLPLVGDTSPPTAPKNLTANTINTTSVQLIWAASTDNVAVTSYDIYRNGLLYLQLPNASSTNLNLSGLTPNTTYTFTVRAKDAAGNVSLHSNTVSVTTPLYSVTNTPSPTPTRTPTPIGIGSSNPTPTSIGSTVPTATPTIISNTSPYYPNDPYYSTTIWNQPNEDMWGLKRIQMEDAWSKSTGSRGVVIGLIDSGIDREHEDLKENIWINPNEINNNGIDDDSNGYIDDIYGWDFTSNSNNPQDLYGHGTLVAGVMGAVGNNSKGVVGSSWKTSIMDLRVYDANAASQWSYMIQAIQYATDMNVDIIHNSYQGPYNGSYAPLEDALKYAHERGVVLIAPAGNYNQNALDNLPSSSPYTIVIGAMDYNNLRSIWGNYASNYGEKIDVTAPGTNILTTQSQFSTRYVTKPSIPKYTTASGTSVSSPFATGLVALLLAKNPSLTNEEIRQILRTSATDIGSTGKDTDHGYGRINGTTALIQADNKPLAPFISSPIPYQSVSGIVQVVGSAQGANFANYKLEIGAGRSPSTWNIITNSTIPVTNNVLGLINTSNFSAGSYSIKLTVTDNVGKKYEYQMFDISLSPSPSATPTVTLSPTSSPTATLTPTITITPTKTPTPTFTPTPTPDKTSPIVTITNPLNNAVVTKNTTITMQATATDPSGVARVEFRVNGNRICNDTTTPYSCAWNVPNKVRTHNITVRAFDSKNNSTAILIKISAQ